ncbi:MAG: LysR substrate-binding domain-containing protein [Ottowia sp.]|uniref:LysR substrate-binding domain-containing protein n=1 Tax=Ottowia sp. TaxID=1898956 RepID=UPI0039E55144
MDLRQLKYFTRIVEAGSLSRAAEVLYVAQPALSKQIAQMESSLGVQLLSRSVRGMTPTEAGLAVYRSAKIILKQIEATYSLANAAKGQVRGSVAVGLPWTLSVTLGLALLRRVNERLPGVRLELTEEPTFTLSRSLSLGKLDMALMLATDRHVGLAFKPLVRERLYLTGAKGSLAGRLECQAKDLVDYPLLLPSRPNATREALQKIWDAQGVQPTILAEINAQSIAIEAMHSGYAFSIVPACVVSAKWQAGLLDAAVLTDPGLDRTVCLATAVELPTTEAAERVKELILEVIADAVNEGPWEATLAA